MTDGPIYRDVENPDAAFVHIHVEDLAKGRAMMPESQFMEATRQAGVIRRGFYLASKQERPTT
jgi:hypothetical protein